MFFAVEGTGHLLGRQYSVVTDEPLFRGFNFVMEGNNEVDIDGQPRKLDYLGTEDSFTFSWGFQRPFAGLRAGMTLVKHDLPAMLSIYRFHDHQPIRFNKSLRWHINWSQEKRFFAQTTASGRSGEGRGGQGRLLGRLRHGLLLVPDRAGRLPARSRCRPWPSGRSSCSAPGRRRRQPRLPGREYRRVNLPPTTGRKCDVGCPAIASQRTGRSQAFRVLPAQSTIPLTRASPRSRRRRLKLPQALQVSEVRLEVGPLGGEHGEVVELALLVARACQFQRLLGGGQDFLHVAVGLFSCGSVACEGSRQSILQVQFHSPHAALSRCQPGMTAAIPPWFRLNRGRGTPIWTRRWHSPWRCRTGRWCRRSRWALVRAGPGHGTASTLHGSLGLA